jgi:hypothetical protein
MVSCHFDVNTLFPSLYPLRFYIMIIDEYKDFIPEVLLYNVNDRKEERSKQ